MSGRPKRAIKPVSRYEPEEIPVDDDYEDELLEESEARKRLRGEFDGYDDDEEDEESAEPNEYDVDDGFAVPDDFDEDEAEIVDHVDEDEEEEEYEDDDEEEEEGSIANVYGEEEDDDEEGSMSPVYESDVVVPEGRLEKEAQAYFEEEGVPQPMDEEESYDE